MSRLAFRLLPFCLPLAVAVVDYHGTSPFTPYLEPAREVE